MKRLLTVAFTLPLALLTSAVVRGDDQARPASCTPAQKDPQRHEQFLKDKAEALEKGPVNLLWVGDSITDAWRGGPQNKLYVQRWGKHNPLNIGISGDKTEHVLWRLDNGEVEGIRPKAVVVMIGTNNLGNPPKATPEDTAAGVTCVVRSLREKLPDAKILLLGVFPRGAKADDPYRAQIKTINDTIAKLDDGGKHVTYLDIGDKFLAPDGTLPADIMPDALHPNEKGYQIWADAIGPTLDGMLK
jgi:beta-glucosidase